MFCCALPSTLILSRLCVRDPENHTCTQCTPCHSELRRFKCTGATRLLFPVCWVLLVTDYFRNMIWIVSIVSLTQPSEWLVTTPHIPTLGQADHCVCQANCDFRPRTFALNRPIGAAPLKTDYITWKFSPFYRLASLVRSMAALFGWLL